MVRSAFDYVKRLMRPMALEAGVRLDPNTGLPVGFTGKILFDEPSAAQSTQGFMSVDSVLALANSALDNAGYSVWVLLDRLDSAFVGSEQLEVNALRALFRVYLDIRDLNRIALKIFLRTDIWGAITEVGFREASHITRAVILTWDRSPLLNLALRRLLKSPTFIDYYGVKAEEVLATSRAQEELMARAFPDQVDTGRNPKTFDWMLGRAADATGEPAPRELIHMLGEVRNEQLKLLETGQPEPPDEQIFDRAAFRNALAEVSRARLEQTIYAEYPDLKEYLQALKDEKTSQTPDTLAEIWGVDQATAFGLAKRLVEIGVFELRGTKREPSYRVPFLYRPALRVVQGTAQAEDE